LVIVDGGIGTVAETVYHLATQPKSAWSFEVDVRPFKENW